MMNDFGSYGSMPDDMRALLTLQQKMITDLTYAFKKKMN